MKEAIPQSFMEIFLLILSAFSHDLRAGALLCVIAIERLFTIYYLHQTDFKSNLCYLILIHY